MKKSLKERAMERPWLRRFRARNANLNDADKLVVTSPSCLTECESDDSDHSNRSNPDELPGKAAADDNTEEVKEEDNQDGTDADITTNEPSRLRKASAAVGGGAMLSVGAVLMVTPLHPIGHALALGGGYVLGSEFEGARKAGKSVKDRFNRLRGKEDVVTDGNGDTPELSEGSDKLTQEEVGDALAELRDRFNRFRGTEDVTDGDEDTPEPSEGSDKMDQDELGDALVQLESKALHS